MRNAPFPRLFSVALLACTSIAWAQTGTPSGGPPTVPVAAAKTALAAVPQPTASANQLIERIHVEGGSSHIDELRVGGETRSITVQPKGAFPAYDVQPATGTRAWKVLGF